MAFPRMSAHSATVGHGAEPTLAEAFAKARTGRWRGTRTLPNAISATQKALDTIRSHWPAIRYPSEVTTDRLTECVAEWLDDGFSPSTITRRLCCLSVLGVNTVGTRPHKRRVLKWWLKPDDHTRLVCHLRHMPQRRHAGDLADFVDWTVCTGLRVEETLRLTWAMASDDLTSITVPGLKTSASQASLPVSGTASGVLKSRKDRCSSDPLIFAPMDYRSAATLWSNECRGFLGEEGNTYCTLKALRRSAARYLHSEGMPLDEVRHYLRHESIHTTMGYLHLTGGYNQDEIRRWLPK